MSATTRPMSPTKRKSLATQQLLSALGTDQTAAVTAALEVINEQLAWDATLRQSLRQKYDELESLAKPKQKLDLGPAPTPISGRGLDQPIPDLNKLDPYQLLREFGPDQLRAVLKRATQRLLREAVDAVQAREPATMPASRARNADMIDYIVAQVAGPGY